MKCWLPNKPEMKRYKLLGLVHELVLVSIAVGEKDPLASRWASFDPTTIPGGSRKVLGGLELQDKASKGLRLSYLRKRISGRLLGYRAPNLLKV